jgi:SAM-dependent methyltransferase
VKSLYDGGDMAKRYAAHRDTHPDVLNALLRHLADAGGPAVELGCGTGNYCRAMRAGSGDTIIGAELSASMLAQARAAGASPLAQAAATAMPLAGKSMGLVYSVDVIHHVADLPAYFSEARRILRDGGILLTATDSEWIIRHREPLATYFPETTNVDLDRYPSIPKLRELMSQAGFRDIQEQAVENKHEIEEIGPYRSKAYSCLHLISEAAFRAGIARMEHDLVDSPIPCNSRYLLLTGRE